MGLIIGREVPLQAKLCVLEIFPEDFVVTHKQSLLIDYGLLQDRRVIVLLGRSKETPSTGTWTKELMACLALKRLIYIVKKKEKKFVHLWSPYIAFLETHDFEF